MWIFVCFDLYGGIGFEGLFGYLIGCIIFSLVWVFFD